MARPRAVVLKSAGVSAILRSDAMHRAIEDVADVVADNVKALGIKVGDKDGGSREVELPVTVRMSTTDRAHANVTLAHPAGQAVQAKHGALTKAAGQAGLDVNTEGD